MLSFTEENYLKAAYTLSGEGENAVLTNDLAAKLNTRPASVTDMIQKLSSKKLVKYEKYYGIYLTPLGKKEALQVVRKHRLWETFLVKTLGFKWDQVHEVAEQLEHIQSPLLIEKLDAHLGFPTADPHGDPIPDREGKIAHIPTTPLHHLPVGSHGKIISLQSSQPELLQQLEKIKLRPGASVTILNKKAFDESVEIQVGNKKISLSKQVSQQLLMAL